VRLVTYSPNAQPQENAHMRVGAAGLGPRCYENSRPRSTPVSQFLENAHTLACDAGLGSPLL